MKVRECLPPARWLGKYAERTLELRRRTIRSHTYKLYAHDN